MTSLTQLPQRIASILLRSALLLAGLVFGVALLFAGLLAAVGLLLWSLLRGRRPMLPLYWKVFRAAARRPFGQAGMRQPGGGTAWHTRAAAPRADVVDVEVREVATSRLPSER